MKDRRNLATLVLIVGIIGLVFSWVPFLGLFLGIIAIVFGGLALKSSARGRAIAGLVIGIIATFFSLITLLTFFAFVHTTGTAITDNEVKNTAGIIKSAVYQYMTSHDDQLPQNSEDLAPYLSKEVPRFSTVVRDYAGTPIEPQFNDVIIVKNARCSSNAQGTTVKQDAAAAYVLVMRLPSGRLYCP